MVFGIDAICRMIRVTASLIWRDFMAAKSICFFFNVFREKYKVLFTDILCFRRDYDVIDDANLFGFGLQ